MNPITRLFRILPATILSGLLLTTASHSVEETTWGSVKEQLTSPAAKPNKNASKTGKKSSNKSSGNVNNQTSASNTIAGNFTASGGHLTVKQDNEGEYEVGDLKVKFKVPKNAVPKNVRIDMTITGSKASDLDIVFGPSGLIFDKTCTLEITLGPEAMDLLVEDLDPYHIHGDGTPEHVDDLEIIVKENGDVKIIMSVDGFSRYGLSGGF